MVFFKNAGVERVYTVPLFASLIYAVVCLSFAVSEWLCSSQNEVIEVEIFMWQFKVYLDFAVSRDYSFV